jgi:hypothetical protein
MALASPEAAGIDSKATVVDSDAVRTPLLGAIIAMDWLARFRSRNFILDWLGCVHQQPGVDRDRGPDHPTPTGEGHC